MEMMARRQYGMKKEDQNILCKQGWRDEYLRWVCGFVHADDRWMVIGMRPDDFHEERLNVVL